MAKGYQCDKCKIFVPYAPKKKVGLAAYSGGYYLSSFTIGTQTEDIPEPPSISIHLCKGCMRKLNIWLATFDKRRPTKGGARA